MEKATERIKELRGRQEVGSRIYLDDVKRLTPLGQTVILKDLGGFVEQERESGIIVPKYSAHPVQIGEVVKSTKGYFEKGKKYERFFETPLKKGDKVLFYYFGANKLRTEKGDLLISKLSDIIGKIDA